ncbi:lipopolysaccharide biosynthesis protein [Rhizobium sp. AAP43]|uniref:lipopolysaccharide biosynthesis protein n=1 Tax=Rhizobium sp. AAP43 TaxID=1523420 RepID=UPI0006B8AE61|nr:lipopolysaccharide biosynthesis protein [Rhizobium sp. AAP43]KPF46891.1 hypothetical protein IP76_03205 [Rhizobium sp. AAP43]
MSGSRRDEHVDDVDAVRPATSGPATAGKTIGMIATLTDRLRGAVRNPDLRGALVTTSVRLVAAVVGLVLQVTLARLMALQDYGIYVILWTWVSVAGQIGVFGFYSSSMRFVPRYGRRGRPGHVSAFLATGFRVVILGSVLLSALALAVLVFGRSLIDPAFLLPLTVLSLGFPILSLETYLTGVSRSFGWYMLATVPGFILRPIIVITGFLIARAIGITLDATEVLTLVVLCSLVVLSLQAGILRRRLASGRTADQSEGPADETGFADHADAPPPSPLLAALSPAALTRHRRFWIVSSLLLMPAMAADELFVWIDVLLLGFLVPPEQASLYFAAQRALSLAAFVQYGFMVVAARGFSLSHATADRAELQARITGATNATFWLTIPSVLLTVIVGYPLLSLFGPAFLSAYPCLLLLGLAYILRGATGQAAELLMVQGRYRLNFVMAAGSITAAVVFVILLVPVLGILGAALAMALVQLLRLVLGTWLIYRKTGYWVLVRPFRRG